MQRTSGGGASRVPGTRARAGLRLAAVRAGLLLLAVPTAPAAPHPALALLQSPPTRIHDIQGAAHRSPLAGMLVSGVGGIVTAVSSNGFYFLDPTPDTDDATSEGLFVFTSTPPTVAVGGAVAVSGRVTEFRPGGASSANLTTTELTAPTITVLSSGNPLPSPVVLGMGGRVPPTTVIEDDASGSVETSGLFDPATDGIDFYESLEGMRVQVNGAVAVSPRTPFGEIAVLGDNGALAAVRSPRGGIVVRAADFNPERILLDDALRPTPSVNVGDHFTTPVVGMLDYSFGNFKLLITQPLTAVLPGLGPEQTTPAGVNQLAVATLTVENLDPGDGAAKFTALAQVIVTNLRAPDLLALEEVQDNNGPTNDSVTDASQTLGLLIAAIQQAGGPLYQYRQIDPVDDQDSGEPGGNIRVVFLFRTDRDLEFVDRPGGGSTTATTVVAHPSGPRLSASPGRIDPANAAWIASRKPLAGEFRFRGERFFVVANHFVSKGGDQPLFGRFQPPALPSEVQRHQQAQLVHTFVASILALDPGANVIVLGDLNDFEFSQTLALVRGTELANLVEQLPVAERYTFIFDGNGQVLDHVLVTQHIAATMAPSYDIVHVNTEFVSRVSDHDPSVARLQVRPGPPN
jgi:endonuclease/exonuclease/phosphatase family metal-dependent hydrolase